MGYAVRLEAKETAETRLLFCTTGVLLSKLRTDPTLAAVSHVVVDEVHERPTLAHCAPSDPDPSPGPAPKPYPTRFVPRVLRCTSARSTRTFC